MVSIGIIGDFNPNKPSHPATNNALYHAANYLSLEVNITWIPTTSIPILESKKRLEQFDGLWASPGSPYQSMDGAIKGIQFAREQNRPFFGT